ncbi:MAG: hypothetical protein JO110_08105 [Acetobacteraceae bacterium]|nr:hypothetical protein [Acetobacteraceae bacterium]
MHRPKLNHSLVLFHRDHNGIAAEAQHQSLAFGLEVHDNAGLVLQPQIAPLLVPKT